MNIIIIFMNKNFCYQYLLPCQSRDHNNKFADFEKLYRNWDQLSSYMQYNHMMLTLCTVVGLTSSHVCVCVCVCVCIQGPAASI